MANLHLELKAYFSKLPDTKDPNPDLRMQEIWENAEAVLTVGTMELVNNSVDGEQYALNSHAIERVPRLYDLGKGTVAPIVLGRPGLGKSTCLNHIVQFCLEHPDFPLYLKWEAQFPIQPKAVKSSPALYPTKNIKSR